MVQQITSVLAIVTKEWYSHQMDLMALDPNDQIP